MAFRRIWIGVALFGLSFGYVEAAVVEYLRALYDPIHERLNTGRAAGDLFPVLRLDQLKAADPRALRWLGTEIVREGATLVMLGALALVAGATFHQFVGAFLVAFGAWDIAYYGFLRILVGWPSSLLDWDLLFLLPVPWAGPVLAPVIVAASMVGAGTLLLWREGNGEPIPISGFHWTMLVLGGVLIVTAFCLDFQNIVAGGKPNPFPWWLFTFGEALGLGSFGHAAWPTSRRNGMPSHASDNADLRLHTAAETRSTLTFQWLPQSVLGMAAIILLTLWVSRSQTGKSASGRSTVAMIAGLAPVLLLFWVLAASGYSRRTRLSILLGALAAAAVAAGLAWAYPW